jgi:signal transduction histidine kinase
LVIFITLAKREKATNIMSNQPPVPHNEMDRIMNLSDFNLDYSNFENNFSDLARLAAKVAGTPISLVNLIDSYTQWTISNHGLAIDQMPREDSVCQYTITTSEHFEVADLSKDDRFKDKFYVKGEPLLRYYYGIPLKSDGYNIGALCVFDKEARTLPPEKIELLKIIGEEIINRLKAYKVIEALRAKIAEGTELNKKVAHDIRGPLAGIIGLSQIISEKGDNNTIDEVLEFINLIHKSGRSLLDLTDEILSADKSNTLLLSGSELNLLIFKEKLEKLYNPQAINKNILFSVHTSYKTENIPFSKNKLLQIAGNLISNAMKFTPVGGTITVALDLSEKEEDRCLNISVSDSGVGMDEEKINLLLGDNTASTNGTDGEKGYGFGLALVKHLIAGLKGTLNITSSLCNGTRFVVSLPQYIIG